MGEGIPRLPVPHTSYVGGLIAGQVSLRCEIAHVGISEKQDFQEYRQVAETSGDFVQNA